MFKKKKIKDVIEEDQARTEEATQIGTMIQQFIDQLKGARGQNEDMLNEMNEKKALYQTLTEKHKETISSIDKVLKALGEE